MYELTDRQIKILKAIIEDYIETAEPVGSETLDKKYNLGVSPATIRNEMVRLTTNKFLRQPHTSAGRIPTEKGYRFFLENYVQAGRITDREKKAIQNVLKKGSVESSVKEVAKKLAEFSERSHCRFFGQ